ncbi:MAG: nicotinate (nicotinamide) nucleotide adenylyltransferase [Bacteroidales bacterium]|nr:nicotinate (nicotinamide) nucleotide adenylyltransferase [Bacteroidales bacterium]
MAKQIVPSRRVALFFGSFNPIHKGHYAIAKYLTERTDADEVWLVVTPHNPLGKKDLADAKQRLSAARNAMRRTSLAVTVSDVEFHLPEPTYTLRTLEYLDAEDPKSQHILVIGADNLATLDRWYGYQQLIDRYEIWVYPRLGFALEALCKLHNSRSANPRIRPLSGVLYNLSSTEIREGEKAGLDMSSLRM